MKLNKIFCFLFMALLLGRCECDDDIGKETLPPATQTGANTFGCLVNGKVWLPEGHAGMANLDVSYDPTFEGGTFDIATYRVRSEEDSQYIYIYIYIYIRAIVLLLEYTV